MGRDVHRGLLQHVRQVNQIDMPHLHTRVRQHRVGGGRGEGTQTYEGGGGGIRMRPRTVEGDMYMAQRKPDLLRGTCIYHHV